jgi:two-component system, OmpR family, sensor histidine kinase KdpD
MARGTLRVYLGAAPGVGKTFAMLNEGWRRCQRGADVVVGLVETHNRANTAAQLQDLEVVPRRVVSYRDTSLTEMDVDAVLARRPEVALVDELAHTNAPGSRHEKRWQDIEELLDAGIDVITTLNIQHLESLNDVVARITGVTQRETVPDALVRRADQIELVDMSPEALRRRMAHGNIYPSERVDAAMANYFRPGNLGALRELALLWVADRVEDSLQAYLADHGITAAWETRERVVVALTGAPSGEALIRRAARMAGRFKGELVGVRVLRSDGLATRPSPELEVQRRLLDELGGTYHEVVGDDPAVTLVDFAHGQMATQLVLGATGRSRRTQLLSGSVISRVVRLAGPMDVHVISTDAAVGEPPVAERHPPRALPRRRRWLAAGAAVVVLPVLTVVLVQVRGDLALQTVLLLYLAVVVAIAGAGGLVVGLSTAVAGFLLVNWYFTPPIETFTISDPENFFALVEFVLVAALVSVLVDRAARRHREALRARTEAEALARTTASLLTEEDPLPGLVAHVQTTFGFAAAALMARDGSSWLVVSAHGTPVPSSPADGTAYELGTDEGTGQYVLVTIGPALPAEDQRVLRSLCDQITMAIDARQLEARADQASALADVDAVRTALLQAVSHDLRTPLASIKAYVTGLQQTDVTWSAADQAEALAAIDAETDRLDRLVGNLLDMSRLQAGALAVVCRPTAIDEPIAAALSSLAAPPEAVRVDVADDLPLVDVDPVLLERAIANLVANAVGHSPPQQPVRVEATDIGGDVYVRVVDRGPGIPTAQRATVFSPFQRLGDRPDGNGVGLGLAIARGFILAIGGELALDDTPGGGLTATITLHAVPSGGPAS